MNNYIASNIRYLRRQLSESQSDFAKRIGLNRDNIASYERGTEPRLEAINKIVNFFHLSFEDFIHTDLSKTKSEENLTFLNDEKKTKSEEKPYLFKR